MAYKEAKIVKTVSEWKKMTREEVVEALSSNVSVEKCKAFLLKLIEEGVIDVQSGDGIENTLYELTHGRVRIGAPSVSGVAVAGVAKSA